MQRLQAGRDPPAGGNHGDRGRRRRAGRDDHGDRACRTLRAGAIAPAARPGRARQRAFDLPAALQGAARRSGACAARIMRETEDGFRIAEEDLKLRGEGEVLGTRQSGIRQLPARLARRPCRSAGNRARRRTADHRDRCRTANPNAARRCACCSICSNATRRSGCCGPAPGTRILDQRGLLEDLLCSASTVWKICLSPLYRLRTSGIRSSSDSPKEMIERPDQIGGEKPDHGDQEQRGEQAKSRNRERQIRSRDCRWPEYRASPSCRPSR
jgi:hypothetical protein